MKTPRAPKRELWLGEAVMIPRLLACLLSFWNAVGRVGFMVSRPRFNSLISSVIMGNHFAFVNQFSQLQIVEYTTKHKRVKKRSVKVPSTKNPRGLPGRAKVRERDSWVEDESRLSWEEVA